MKNQPITPQQAFEWWDSLPPIEIKNRIGDYLLWQAKHGKILLHFSHYLRIAKYGYQPRESTNKKQMSSLDELTRSIGKTVS